MRKIKVFDTTLRDGEQTPGVSLNLQNKLEIAHTLADLGVDIIEAGFPVSSKLEFNTVKEIARKVDTTICGLSRSLKPDIDKCIEANVHLIHTFISTSPQHLKYQMNKTEGEVLEMAVKAVQYIKDKGFVCMFSPMDASRSDFDFLKKVCIGVQDAGVDIINIPDTVGIMYPSKMKEMMSKLRKVIKVDMDVHCHNDFGLAVANTLAAVEAGANQVQVTVNGLGERAGNADLEQVVMACEMIHGLKTNIQTKKIYRVSKLVQRLTGVRVMPNFPIVGDNAFAHESGIHVDGILKKAITFEPIKPEMVGARRKLVLGKLIGAHGVDAKLKEFNIEVDGNQLLEITNKVKELGAKGKRVFEEDLIAIAENVIGKVSKEKRLVEMQDMKLQCNFKKNPSATVKLNVSGQVKEATADGVGPVDATLNAIKKCIGDKKLILEEYHLDAISGGSDALAYVTIRLSNGNNDTIARGVHEDVVMASAIAFINGLNRILIKSD